MNSVKIRAWSARLLAMGLTYAAVLVPASGVAASATSHETPACSHLVLAAGQTTGTLGTGSLVILVANAGARCELEGYPRVVFFNARGVPVDTINVHSGGPFAMERPRVVLLARNAVASIGVSWAQSPSNHGTCPLASWADVSLPDGIGSLEGGPAVNAAPCGGYLRVTPLETGPSPTLS
ncbi:MAG TPA: DUF4232 domain-containing protein [Acidimicrobiales bacterium]|nr:DUF4232 domain-containing protein [Acidimicrobiales bacterium]